jgi:IMP dehydrogenase
MNNRRLKALIGKYFSKKGLPKRPALTFDDVVILDRFSDIRSRSDILNLKTRLAKNVCLNIPIVSANMDTVTNSKMAITLARLGGLGFIHQFFSLNERAEEVNKVKRADNAIIDDPVKIGISATLGEAKELMAGFGISSILVVDENNKLAGILTSRDYRFKHNGNIGVKTVMTPMPLITASPALSRPEIEKLLEKHKIEKLPLIDKNGAPVGLITAKDMLKERSYPNAIRDEKGRLCVGATLRLNADYLHETETLINAGADVLLLDTARANSGLARDAVISIKKNFPHVPLVVGNIDTPEAANMLIKAGADCLKIGIGPGSACKTREVAGVGIPQITAIASCAAISKKGGIPLIADGGIRNGSDLSKALVAGVNVVMIGSLFAGTDESPGELFRDANQQWKIYRGSASLEHQFDRIEFGSLDAIKSPEGVPRRILYTGSIKTVIDELLDGLRSSMSYVGARNLNEFGKKGKFVWQTTSGHEEGKPRI